MKNFTQIDARELEMNAFDLGSRWAILSAGDENGCNGMTVSWGQFGILWNDPIVTVYVRPQRHTLQFIESSDYFTLSLFPEQYRDALSFYGSHSGRDVNKADAAGLNVVCENGFVLYEEAETVFLCKKLYRQEMRPDCFLEESYTSKYYPNNDYHVVFIGKIVSCLKK